MILPSFRDLSKGESSPWSRECEKSLKKEVKAVRSRISRIIGMIISRIIINAAETTDKIISMLYYRVALYACDFSIRETDRG